MDYAVPHARHCDCGFLAFGAGALLFAVTVELYGEALHELERDGFTHGAVEICVLVFFAILGAWGYLLLNRWMDKVLSGDHADHSHKKESKDEEKQLAEAAKEEALRMSLEFSARSLEVREYLDSFFGQPMKDALQTLATERPADPKGVLGNVLLGKKSLGQVHSEPKTTDPALRTAAPRQYLDATVSPPLVSGLSRCFMEKPPRPVSHLGEIMTKHCKE